MRLVFLGHATVRIELGGTTLLTDAVLGQRVAFLRRTAPPPMPQDVAGVDAVLISHLHQDHCDLPSLTRLGRQRALIVPAGSGEFFRRRRFTDVRELRVGECCVVGSVEVTATDAAHDGWRPPFGPHAPAVGFVVAARGTRVYFAGDTGLFDGMRGIGDGLDVALLPVAGWGRTLGPGHLDPVTAAEASRLLRPSLVVPVHWGGLRPIWNRAPVPSRASAPAEAFADQVRRRRLPVEVAVVQPGQATSWPG